MDGLRDLVSGLREAVEAVDDNPTQKWLSKYPKSAVAKFGQKGVEPISPWKHGASEPSKHDKAATAMLMPVPAKPKWTSAGCVVLPSLHPDDLNFVYLIKPSNNYGPWAFPKGRIDKGETAPEAARRECAEEAGLVVHILPGGYLGKGTGSHSITHYFMAVQTGGSASPQDHEVSEVRLCSFEEAWKLFKGAGNQRDLGILQKAWKFTDKFRKRSAGRDVGGMQPVGKGERRPWAPPK